MNADRTDFPIDHVELPVADRYEAAEWFADTLKFEINEAYEHWAQLGGPLLVSPDGGSPHLALVSESGDPPYDSSPGHVALRVSGPAFLELIEDLNEQGVTTRSGNPVSPEAIIDRDGAYAVMITDPYDNRFELISYDCENVEASLDEQ